MMHLKRLLAVPVLVQLLFAAPAVLAAGEGVPTPAEVRAAEAHPPLIPHRSGDADRAQDCLKCHLKGKNATSHPERKLCSACHVQGEGKQPMKRKK